MKRILKKLVMTSEEVRERIEPALRSRVQEREYIVQYCQADELSTARRIDIAGKASLLRSLTQRSATAQHMYEEIIKVLTAGKYREKEDVAQRDYASSFTRLEQQLLANGFSHDESLVPVSSSGDIINGSHRVAASILHGLQVPTVQLDGNAPDYSAESLIRAGCPRTVVRQCVAAYTEFRSTFALVVWPNAMQNFLHLLDLVPRVVYSEQISLSTKSLLRLIEACYFGEEWIASGPGALANKLNLVTRGAPTLDVGVVLFETDGISTAQAIKAQLRDMCKNNPHSLHISDEATQAVRIARFTFNPNSIHFAELAPIASENQSSSIICRAQESLAALKLEPSEMAIDGGSVLSAYGIRPSLDFDIVVRDSFSKFELPLGVTQRSQVQAALHGEPIDAILDVNQLHFWHHDVKFVALQQVAKMKRIRNEHKDLADVALIEGILPKPVAGLTSRERWLFRKYWFRNIAEDALRFIGLHKATKSLLDMVRKVRSNRP